MKPFPWRRGMTAIDERGERWLIVESDGKDWAQCRPDPDDGATKGALLDAVRKAWAAPAAQVTPYVRWDPHAQRMVIDEWMVCLNDAEDRMFRGHSSEFAALLAAWEAAP